MGRHASICFHGAKSKHI